LGQKLILGRQIHADIYRALQCIEENELEGEDQGRLLEVSSRASALILILEDLFGSRCHPRGEDESGQASGARTARSEARSPDE
jgi:hypothetical protein